MKTRPSRKSCDGFRRRDSMNAQTPPGSRATDSYLSLSTSDVEGTTIALPANGATWDNAIVSSEGVSREGSCHHPGTRSCNDVYPRPRSFSMAERDIAEELVDRLKDYLKGVEGYGSEERCEELADAFKHAAVLPPITKQSLSELDIQNIIANIKLRHDVNFDKDLSFRPNNEGLKGQQKARHSDTYWLALEAELHLYTSLFIGTPPFQPSGQVKASMYLQRAQKRVPQVFETIHDVLKSLVPDRDHQRVDEHLDVRMLMQEIERGVCDMVALIEWTARLLKEHCAPMRDQWVDDMVKSMRKGAAENNLKKIISSLQALIGMLETMKLDVANHQIRNLKPLLIEDTISYEKHYHVERIVNKRSKVNFEAAQSWWTIVVQDLQTRHALPLKATTRSALDMFSQAVVSSLFPRSIRKELPDTFYLDSDRLRILRSEIEDLIHFEVCFSLFDQLRKDFGHDGAVSNATKRHIRSSLSAIMGETMGHGSQAWLYNSESLSLEIYRQAQVIAGRAPVLNHQQLHTTNECLRSMFDNTLTSHATTLEAVLLPQVHACIKKHSNSSPTELYNNLVATPPPTSIPSFIPAPSTTDTFSLINNTPQDRLSDLSKRISHIILLHWRIWAPIVYDDASRTATNLAPPQRPAATSSAQAQSAGPPPPAPMCPAAASEHDMQVVGVMKTGEPPDSGSGYGSGVSDQTRMP